MAIRGTSITPGADPTRLLLGLDPEALSIAEGIRAGLAAALPVALATILHQPGLALAALGALLTCIADPAGPPARRLPLLLTFVTLGASLLGAFGLARAAGLPQTLVLAAPVLFATGFIRIYGAPVAAIGSLLAVVLLLGTDEPLTHAQALHEAGLFAAGGAWALLLTLALWRIHPYGPARKAVARVWKALANQARMILTLLEPSPHSDAEWESLARASRGHVRGAIERARMTLMDTMQARGPASGPASQNLLRLEEADRVFAILIALSDQLEHAGTDIRAPATAMLRRLRPLLRILAAATQTEHAARRPRLNRAIDAILLAVADAPALQHLGTALAESLRAAIGLINPARFLPGSTIAAPESPGAPRRTLRQSLAAPARANLTWRSAALRHAVRTAAVTTGALAYTLTHQGTYTHWLTITLVLVMQPFFAATWQRSLERVGGTLLGGGVAAGLSSIVHNRLALAALLPALGAVALAVRQISYGLYIAVYTPVIILLVEQFHPEDTQAHIALARAGYTIAGGLLAIAANALLWPAWQPAQVARDLRAAKAAHAAYARLVLLAPRLADGRAYRAELAQARRATGLASNNLEASLQRAMHEPRRGQRTRLQATLIADATLRRIAGRLTTLALMPPVATATAAWIAQALAASAEGLAVPVRPAEADAQLDRLAGLVERLVGGGLG